MSNPTIAIIGAGLTGLSIAKQLQDSQATLTLFDKSRGVSGRLATRRAKLRDQIIRFDHGTPFLTSTQAARIQTLFGEATKTADAFGGGLQAALTTAPSWPPGIRVAPPGMNQVGKILGHEMTLHLNTTVVGLNRDPHTLGWRIINAEGSAPESFDLVILTTPPRQAASILFNTQSTLVHALTALEPEGCWSLMMVLAQPLAIAAIENVQSAVIQRVISEHAKGRESTNYGVYTIQAERQWSQQHMDTAPEDVTDKLLAELRRLGFNVENALHQQLHRWLYAGVRDPVGEAFIEDSAQKLICAGDWCLGNDIDSALDSADAVVQRVAGWLG